VKRVVLDASVVLKWYLLDEQYGPQALQLLSQYISEDMDITAPALLEYELMNGLAIARRRGRIDEETISVAIEGFLNLGIVLVELSEIYQRITHYCHAYNRSAYDASYLAVAEKKNLHLITADERLFNSVKNDLSWVTWLGDV